MFVFRWHVVSVGIGFATAVLFSLGCCLTPVSSQQTDPVVSLPNISIVQVQSPCHSKLPSQDSAIKWRDKMRRIWENTCPIGMVPKKLRRVTI